MACCDTAAPTISSDWCVAHMCRCGLPLNVPRRICAATARWHVAHWTTLCVHAQMWPAFRNCFVMDVLRRHYRVRIVTPLHPFMDVTRHHLCVQFPHSVFPLSCFLNPALVGAPGSGRH